MKQMDYWVSGIGTKRTISPRSEHAKQRTPDVLSFDGIEAALNFVNKAVKEGFRFSGRELVDRSYKLVPYGYFFERDDGRVVFSGQDWGPPEPVFEAGDVYPGGPRNGKEAVVLKVVTAEEARVYGVDVAIILAERDVPDLANPPVVTSQTSTSSSAGQVRYIINDLQQRVNQRIARYGKVRPEISAEFHGERFVAVGGRLYHSKEWKFFPDFLRDYVPSVFGNTWWKAEHAKPEPDRHPVVQWRSQGIRFMNAQTPQADGKYAAVPNGALAAYMTFAYDLYTVEHNFELDDLLLRRLKNREQFQGARHELFAEATCLRAGCTIEREDERDPTHRHAEFTAKHPATGVSLSVEAKSKHRPGILGYPGTPPASGKLSLRFGGLINDALQKNPSHPLVVFIDTNLPLRAADHLYAFQQANPPVPSRIMSALLARVRQEHGGTDPYAMLVFTNHPHHYGASYEIDPRKHLLSVMPMNGVPSAAVLALHAAANLYGNIPNLFPSE